MFSTRWRQIGIASAAVVLTLPLLAVPAPASGAAAVDVWSVMDLGWGGATSFGAPTAVSGGWAVGWATVDGAGHAFASDLRDSPPTAIDLGSLGGAEAFANDVSGSWVGGSALPADGDYHAFVADLSAATPELIDLNPEGMVWSSVSDVDGQWAVGEIDSATADAWWGAAWNLTGATTTTVPEPIRLLPLTGDPYAWASRVSGSWVVGESMDAAREVLTHVVWSLSSATTDVPVAAELLALPGEEPAVSNLSGHWAVGSSRASSGRYLPVVWDLSDASPSAMALPVAGTGGEAVGVDGDLVVGYEEFSTSTQRHPVVWDLSSDPPTATALPTFAGVDCENCLAQAIDGNWVVGTSRPDAGSAPRVFAYNLSTDGPLLDLGALVDASEVVDVDGTWVVGRSAFSADVTHPVAWNLLAPALPVLADPVAGNASVNLSWTAPGYTAGADVTGYTVAYRATGSTDWTTTAPTPSTSTAITVGDLSNGTTYQFKVLASTANGDSAYSPVKEAAPVAPATVPAAPGAPVTSKTKSGIALTWTDGADGGASITDHVVKVYSYAKATKRAPEVYTLIDTITTSSSSTVYTVTGLAKGKTYAFTVAAGNSVGFGEFSAYSNVARS